VVGMRGVLVREVDENGDLIVVWFNQGRMIVKSGVNLNENPVPGQNPYRFYGSVFFEIS
jgi:hypothetical protein